MDVSALKICALLRGPRCVGTLKTKASDEKVFMPLVQSGVDVGLSSRSDTPAIYTEESIEPHWKNLSR